MSSFASVLQCGDESHIVLFNTSSQSYRESEIANSLTTAASIDPRAVPPKML